MREGGRERGRLVRRLRRRVRIEEHRRGERGQRRVEVRRRQEVVERAGGAGA
jgi:hypothetical protein